MLLTASIVGLPPSLPPLLLDTTPRSFYPLPPSPRSFSFFLRRPRCWLLTTTERIVIIITPPGERNEVNKNKWEVISAGRKEVDAIISRRFSSLFLPFPLASTSSLPPSPFPVRVDFPPSFFFSLEESDSVLDPTFLLSRPVTIHYSKRKEKRSEEEEEENDCEN